MHCNVWKTWLLIFAYLSALLLVSLLLCSNSRPKLAHSAACGSQCTFRYVVTRLLPSWASRTLHTLVDTFTKSSSWSHTIPYIIVASLEYLTDEIRLIADIETHTILYIYRSYRYASFHWGHGMNDDVSFVRCQVPSISWCNPAMYSL